MGGTATKIFNFQMSRFWRSPSFFYELLDPVDWLGIHQYRTVSYSKVTLGLIKACYCFHHSSPVTEHKLGMLAYYCKI